MLDNDHSLGVQENQLQESVSDKIELIREWEGKLQKMSQHYNGSKTVTIIVCVYHRRSSQPKTKS